MSTGETGGEAEVWGSRDKGEVWGRVLQAGGPPTSHVRRSSSPPRQTAPTRRPVSSPHKRLAGGAGVSGLEGADGDRERGVDARVGRKFGAKLVAARGARLLLRLVHQILHGRAGRQAGHGWGLSRHRRWAPAGGAASQTVKRLQPAACSTAPLPPSLVTERRAGRTWKHLRQKLCWQGACSGARGHMSLSATAGGRPRPPVPACRLPSVPTAPSAALQAWPASGMPPLLHWPNGPGRQQGLEAGSERTVTGRTQRSKQMAHLSVSSSSRLLSFSSPAAALALSSAAGRICAQQGGLQRAKLGRAVGRRRQSGGKAASAPRPHPWPSPCPPRWPSTCRSSGPAGRTPSRHPTGWGPC